MGYPGSKQSLLAGDGGQVSIQSGLLEKLLSELANLMGREAMSATSSDAIGPCLEYLLEQHTLADLVKHAAKDQPRGIRLLVIEFIGNLITADQSLLIHSAINKPL